MGTITLKVPQDIHVEYEIDSLKVIELLLDLLKHLEPTLQRVENNRLLGLFADEADLLDQITDSAMQARENDPLRYHNG